MKDDKVLAYCNLFGILGAIPYLLELDEAARELVRGKTLSLGFAVKDGPHGTLAFSDGKAEMHRGTKGCSIKLYFPSCKAFNALIDGKGMPIPLSGFWHIGFLLGSFTKLTDLLSAYLRPAPEALAEKAFHERSTTLMLHVIAGAIAEIGNHDPVGRFSASNIVGGTVRIGIGDTVAIGIRAEEHHLTALHEPPAESLSEMCFDSMQTARDLFDGRLNALAAVGTGRVRVAGMISQVDNINRILDRVSVYLA